MSSNARRLFHITLLLASCIGSAFSQTVSLSASNVAGVPGGTSAFTVSLASGGAQPSGLEWTMNYSTSGITGLEVAVAGTAASANKTVACTPGSGTVTCILYGMNETVIPDGVVAQVSVSLAPTATAANTVIQFTNAAASDVTGSALAATATGPQVTLEALPIVSALACTPTTITGAGSLTCTVTTSASTAVALSSNSASLTVPANVTVSGTSATFTATAAAVTTAQTAVITASANNTQQTATISLQPTPQVSALTCTPSTITGAGTVTCTVTLKSPAPASGTTVTLTSSSTSVTVPASVTVAASAVSAAFSATASAVSTNNNNVVLTASTNAAQASETLALLASAVVSALSCTPSFVPSGSSTVCSVTLSEPAPAGGALVALSSSKSGLVPPANVTVPAGATSAAFSASANTSVAETVSLTASYAGSSTCASLWLSPPVTLNIQGSPSELQSATNGAKVIPATAPSALAGSLVQNQSGSVNFSPNTGAGVFFLNCCGNTSNAYYKFTGTGVGTVFGASQGQITFNLTSRMSFAQRATLTSYSTVFDVRDATPENHVFYFNTQVVAGSLMFFYSAGGQTAYYYVPQGTEDKLFGSGVAMQVAIVWQGKTLGLYLNGTLVNSGAFAQAKSNWSSASTFDLGALEYLTFGGYDSCGDIISNFTVGPVVQ